MPTGIYKHKVGYKRPPEVGRKVSQTISGCNHWNWKGGITKIRKVLYFSKEYKLWRTAVFERDNYTCIWCGQISGRLNADHIKPWADYPEFRFAIDNGRTLCEDCHKKTDTYGVHPPLEESIQRLIAYNHSQKGKPLTKDHREKISKAKFGLKFSDEHRRHLSESHRKVES